MPSSKNKVNRYKNLFKNVSNWEAYLFYKMFGKQRSFRFDLRNAFSVEVEHNMLSSFKEAFFDDIYFRRLPKASFKKKDMRVIDVGANAGFFSLYTFFRMPEAKVFAYEPVPFNFKILRKYREQFSGFDFNIFNKAVGGNDEKLKLNISKLDGYTTMATVFEKDYNKHQLEVDCLTLAQIMAQNQLDTVDLLKLDCEGAEYEILYNISNQDLHKIQLMCIETHLGTGVRENTSALEKFLKEKNFKVDTLDEGKTGYLWAWKE